MQKRDFVHDGRSNVINTIIISDLPQGWTIQELCQRNNPCVSTCFERGENDIHNICWVIIDGTKWEETLYKAAISVIIV